MFILVQCNTSLSKNYVAHSITVLVHVIVEFEKKKCLHSLAV